MKVSKDFIMREIAGEHILVPVGKSALSIHGIISASESGYFLWQLLQKDRTEEERLAAMLEEYDVPAQTAAEDIHDFLAQMRELGILE